MDWLRAEVHHVLQTDPGLILERRAVDVVHERLTELVRQPWVRDTRVGDAKPANVRWTPPSAVRTPRVGAMGWTSLSPSGGGKALTRRPRNPRAHAATSSNSLEGLAPGIPFARKPSQRDASPRARRAGTCASPLDRARASVGSDPTIPTVRARDPLREQAPRFDRHLAEVVVLGECRAPIRTGNLETASAQIANRASRGMDVNCDHDLAGRLITCCSRPAPDVGEPTPPHVLRKARPRRSRNRAPDRGSAQRANLPGASRPRHRRGREADSAQNHVPLADARRSSAASSREPRSPPPLSLSTTASVPQ